MERELDLEHQCTDELLAGGAGNSGDCHTPLFDLISHLSVTGVPTAQVYYGLDGWTAHHNADIWAEAPPVGDQAGDPTWANWPMGGAWLCQHSGSTTNFPPMMYGSGKLHTR